jgi:hypothetical protein
VLPRPLIRWGKFRLGTIKFSNRKVGKMTFLQYYGRHNVSFYRFGNMTVGVFSISNVEVDEILYFTVIKTTKEKKTC